MHHYNGCQNNRCIQKADTQTQISEEIVKIKNLNFPFEALTEDILVKCYVNKNINVS